jgi:L-cysteine S-thiosulfotransferase
MPRIRSYPLFLLCAVIPVAASIAANGTSQMPYFEWQVENFAINEPLGGLKGNAERGRAIVSDGSRGNCLACHLLPIPEEEYFGNLGPPLTGIGVRQSVGMIRLHVVDQSRFNPETVMPGYYRPPQQLNRVSPGLKGRTWLNAQEIEDVVAYLASLK